MRAAILCASIAISVAAFPSRASAHHHHCVETSRIVGRARCIRFGSWSPPRWLPRLSWTWGVGRLTTTLGRDTTAFGSVARAIAPTAPIDYVVGSSRVTVGLGRSFELGYGLSGGWATAGNTEGLAVFSGEVMAIVNLRLGRVVIRPELATGARFVIPTTSDADVAARTPPGEDPPTGRGEMRTILAPRLSVEATFSSWLAGGFTVGTDVLAPRDRSAGVYFLFRTRSLGF